MFWALEFISFIDIAGIRSVVRADCTGDFMC